MGNKNSTFDVQPQPPPEGEQPPEAHPPPEGQQPPEAHPPPEGEQPPEAHPPPEGQQPPDAQPPPEGQQPPDAQQPPEDQHEELIGIDSVPEDVLLAVFSELHPRDLLVAVRRVCMPWRELSLHPGAWRGGAACVTVNSSCMSLSRCVLEHAPALDYLQLDLQELQGDPLTELAAGTQCAVARLHLTVNEGSEELATRVIRNQLKATPRRLRELGLILWHSISELDPLFSVLWNLTDFDQLSVDAIISEFWPSAVAYPTPSTSAESSTRSLRRLCFRGWSDPLLTALLWRYAHSLQSAALYLQPDVLSFRVSALERCSQLQELELPACYNFASLDLQRFCPLLTTLTINGSGFPPSEVLPEALLAYLRTACLKSLRLLGYPFIDPVEALGCCTRLEKFSLDCRHDASVLVQLPGCMVPGLRALRLDAVPPAEVLGSLRAPDLRHLWLDGEVQCRRRGPEDSCLLQELRGLVDRHPELYLQVDAFKPAHICSAGTRCECPCCAEHPVTADTGPRHGVFAFRKSGRQGLRQSDGTVWL